MDPNEIIENLIHSGSIARNGQTIEELYDPIMQSHDGLDDECFFCLEPRTHGEYVHDHDCPWVVAMHHLGHALPSGHSVDHES